MNHEQYTKDFVSERRMSAWRQEAKERVRAFSEEIADGLFVHFRKGKIVARASEAIEALPSAEREQLWQMIFPGLAEVMELVWTQLDCTMILRRDGGEWGHGERFTWPATASKRSLVKIEWLRKLLIVVGPFPELSLPQALAVNSALSSGSAEEAAGGYADSTGQFYDSDALGYLCATLLTVAPDGVTTREVEAILRSPFEVCGKPPYTTRHVFTALLCAERPDLWRMVNDQLLDAGREAGHRSWLLSSREGAHPDSWVHLMRTIHDHELVRFSEVQTTLQAWSGWPWLWEQKSRDEYQSLLGFWAHCLESPEKRQEAFERSPMETAFALWSEAVYDGPLALQRIAHPTALTADQRLGAVHFLEICPTSERSGIALQYLNVEDLRAAAVAVNLLTDQRVVFPASANPEDIFQRVYDFYQQTENSPPLPPATKPFPQVALDEQRVLQLLADRFPDGREAEIEALLPKMNQDNRQILVRRLNRYNLTTFDREMAEIMHGDDPQEWEAWQADHQGSQLAAQRRLIISMIADPSFEVAEKAYDAIKGFRLSADETAMIKPVLKSKNARKRLLVTQCYSSQPIATNLELINQLLRSTIADERLAGLEVVRVTAGDDSKREAILSLWRALKFEPRTKAEQKACQHLVEIIGGDSPQPDEAATVQNVQNAFGLLDPAKLAPPLQPEDHAVTLHTSATGKIIAGLQQWMDDNAEAIIPPRYPNDPPEGEMLKDIRSLPYVKVRESVEENLKQFPVAATLVQWWRERPDALRDEDGFELPRVRAVLYLQRRKLEPQVRDILSASDPIDLAIRNKLESLVSWLLYLTQTEDSDAWQRFLVQATESAWVRLPDSHQGNANIWSSQLDRSLQLNQMTIEAQKRMWAVCRNRAPGDRSPFNFYINQVAQLFLNSVATEAEFIWRLVGDRDLGPYALERAFADLAMATAIQPRYPTATHDPAVVAITQKVIDRIFDLEMKRGESPEECSYAVRSITALQGVRYLTRILSNLDRKLFRKSHSYESRKDYSRPTVLIHLLSVCFPAKQDTAEVFTQAITQAGIDHDLLLQLAMFRPVWARFVAHTIGRPELPDTVAWIFAHTRGQDYQWHTNAKEIWAGEVGYRSPIPVEEFIDGAVDTDWFFQAYEAIGPDIWAKLYDSAKFASTGKGHVRARVFADALLGNISVDELSGNIESKGDLNAVLAIGLPALPQARQAREQEALKRYEILQGVLARSKQSKAQRRASEQRAVELGIQNLARRAGYSDTLRFEWTMEMLAAEDLKSGALQATSDGVLCQIDIDPDAKLKLSASRDGKLLKSVPAKVKKSPAVKELLERMKTLQKEAQRLRPALEDIMARGVSMACAEWRILLEHPLAGPLLKRLVLVGPGALGLPTPDGLAGPDGQVSPWPANEAELRIAHPLDLLPTETWAQWQHGLFSQQIVQPFKQVFRELYTPTESECAENSDVVKRYQGHLIKPAQSLALLGQRGWIYEPGERLFRKIRNLNLMASVYFTDHFYTPNEIEVTGIDTIQFFNGEGKLIPVPAVPPLVFSEVMRDMDLIVSIAHATGADPKSSPASIDSRAALVRETAKILKLDQIGVEGNFCHIAGQHGDYRVHLGSGIVHRKHGETLPIRNAPEPERGRLFLPFADDDPITAGILSRILLFAHDDRIRDPYLARLIRG